MTAQNVWNDIVTIRRTSPVVHNITNYVVMNTTANALLALGASPVMAHADGEVEDMVGIASALVINIGTLSDPWIASMKKAMTAAHRRNVPVVLDPVGAGATALRTRTVHELLNTAPVAIIRGNASEIRALRITGAGTKGVDSTDSSDSAFDAARQLAILHHCVVSVSGEKDLVVSETRFTRVLNGHPMMPRVTGLGCTAAALTGAFAAVNPDRFDAAVHGMAVMGIAGEIAAEKAAGPGTLQLHFLDSLYGLTEADIRYRIRVDET
ncbi:hydroxyethylthiazole kinase [bacterium]|nr:hydroxyethylthiazole kinase [candidate division CSSED10-310 bacterium]